MRTFGVEEELLLVDDSELELLPLGWQVAERHGVRTETGHELASELQQEQLEVVHPPQTTLSQQLATIRSGRAWADSCAADVGGRVVALATAPGAVTPHLVPHQRFQQMAGWAGITALQQLTGGMHVHVQVHSRAEAVAVLDRIRVWLPTLLALSSNSPFWDDSDTAFHSYRYQTWGRWPNTGPPDLFESIDAYDRQRESLLRSRVPLDDGMIYFDARICERHSTVEVRVPDVCLFASHAAVIATLTRALVETAARDWRAGVPPLPVDTAVLRAWTWRASRCGIESLLVDPFTAMPAPAGEVVTHLLDTVAPVLSEYGEDRQVDALISEILRNGTGAYHQREAFRHAGDPRDVIAAALHATHNVSHPGAVSEGPFDQGASDPGALNRDASARESANLALLNRESVNAGEDWL
ncbi:glutamate--cysteine ligase [Nesterenkonia sp. LB17]|uniref:glutamate--cysteine ligase n=1 Tax=unclassified Nesterenkonia TaxID=2629769 RepID=UPI001F4C6DC8|nr:glutamate--cysteine ligase [Nesterenkonia sp. DZ6]MCH8563897.1 glutamate--cysteine ligase [Nesterenkonia sp. YGD6]MCH8566495.1 glutamate--cysteine ligase [Nesterenkonia sp. LB17]MCH8571943.1 glutamate--cysteine ligase [Nesterenkonia sp. AY15]